jgi:hypothetical protein
MILSMGIFFYRSTGIKFLYRLIIFLIFLLLVSCRATEAPSAGFIQNEQYLYKDPTLPFQKVWIRKGINLNLYRRILIDPINMNYLMKPSFVEALNFKGYDSNLHANKKYISEYMRKMLLNAFMQHIDNRFAVTNLRDYGTLELKMAVVNFVPSKPVINTVSTSLMFVPLISIPVMILKTLILLPVNVALSCFTDSGFRSSIAFEAVICDAATGRVLIAFADREKAPGTILNLKDYSYWGYINSISHSWAEEIVQMLNRRNGEVVEGMSTVEFSPVG